MENKVRYRVLLGLKNERKTLGLCVRVTFG